MDNTTIFPPLSEREIRGAEICRRAAMEGMVLLWNQNKALPLAPGKICLFGNGAVRTIRGGTGSGDPFNGGLSGGGDSDVDLSPRNHIQLLPAMQREGFTAQEKDGLILVNGEIIYYEAGTLEELFSRSPNFRPLKSPVNTQVASIEDDGKTIVYKVRDSFHQTICKGDVQRRAAYILKVMRRLGKPSAI